MTWTGKNEVLDEVIGRAELERMLDEAGATYTSRRIPAGAMVFWSGEPDGNHYYVESGSVELYGVDAAGRKKVIDRYGPGMFFGFHILRDTNLTMSTAQCLEDSRILPFPRNRSSSCFAGARISPNTACAICSGFCPCRPTRC